MNASTSTVMQTKSELLNSNAVAPRHALVGPIADSFEATTSRISDPDYAKAPKRAAYHCAKSSYPKAQSSRVSIDFIEMDLREALLELSIITDFPIIADDSVGGIVSLTQAVLLSIPLQTAYTTTRTRSPQPALSERSLTKELGITQRI